MSKIAQALLYNNVSGDINIITKDKVYSFFNEKENLSYKDIVTKYKLNKINSGIYNIKNLYILIDKTLEDFEKYLKLNNFKVKDSIIQRDKKINIIYLMHKDIQVCKYQTSNIIEDCNLIEIYNIDLMPVGTVINNKVSESQFSEWLKWRSIPYSRKNMKLILQTLNLSSTEFMIKSCNGASLNDLYWYKEEGSNLSWNKINFYDNNWYNSDSKLLFLKQRKGASKQYLNTPDCVSIGNQPKCWVRENGHNYLLKADKSPIAMEAFTEELMCEIIGSHKYTFYEDKDLEICCSKSINFMENYKDKDFVTANWYMQRFNYINDRTHLEKLIKDINSDRFIEMLLFDYVLLNGDRHLDNFGFIRIDTDKFVFAPIYDNGDYLSRNCKPSECMCYLLKNDTENVDYILEVLKPYITDRILNDFFDKMKKFNNIIQKYEDKYKNYDISEYINKKQEIFNEINRRLKMLK